jgi:hypothetical protein
LPFFDKPMHHRFADADPAPVTSTFVLKPFHLAFPRAG